MKTTELDTTELEAVLGGDLAYDVGRLVRFAFLSGGGMFAGQALTDWAGTTAMNDVLASK